MGISRRRTFAIISHPDAGKTTLTEKLLLYWGAIREAGAVKAKAGRKQTTSDWMDLEKQRGISISSTVLQFDYLGFKINLLDTPGHRDFSEDTYRTLMAADASFMIIDAAKGVEAQTRKLFEVARLRGIPIFTFINKMDRSGKDPLDLIDEIEKVLGIRSCVMNWPIGMGDLFKGVYDLQSQTIHYFEREDSSNTKGRLQPKQIEHINEIDKMPGMESQVLQEVLQKFREELELLSGAGDPFDLKRILSGQLTPVFFGSAMNNFGVEAFLKQFVEIAPSPIPRKANIVPPIPSSASFSAIIFKVQANMNPHHRDCLAFARICSGIYQPGIKVFQPRAGKEIKINNAVNVFGKERITVENAVAGDIIGIIDTQSSLRIGDTLTQVSGLVYDTIPRFAPEKFATFSGADPTRKKQLMRGISQLADEGVIQILYRKDRTSEMILGVVGSLQFEVLSYRLKFEYQVDIKLSPLDYIFSRWVSCPPDELSRFSSADVEVVGDRDLNPMMLFKSEWGMKIAKNDIKEIQFFDSK